MVISRLLVALGNHVMVAFGLLPTFLEVFVSDGVIRICYFLDQKAVLSIYFLQRKLPCGDVQGVLFYDRTHCDILDIFSLADGKHAPSFNFVQRIQHSMITLVLLPGLLRILECLSLVIFDAITIE